MELVILLPIFLIAAFLGYGGMRMVAVNGDVDAAALAGARAATTAYSPAAGTGNADRVARAMLDSDAGQRCDSVSVGASGSWSPGGTVTVTVSCVVSMDDLGFGMFPGTKTYEATATDVVDTVRGGS